VTASATGPTGATVSWQASTDDVGVTGYRVLRGGVDIATVTGTSYADGGLAPSTTYAYTVRAVDAAGNVSAASPAAPVTTPAAPTGEFVFVGTGDIAYPGVGDEETARLIDQVVAEHPDAVVFTLGDNAYPDGTAQQFADYYHPTWGRHKARTRPIPGNHDYRTANGQAYFDYFGDRAGEAGKGYYSYDLGEWHLLALNSEIDISATSVQYAWLKADLEANASTCTLAYWHEPRFSSGANGSNPVSQAVWQLLYEHGADVVLNGHDHNYERFAPMNPAGELDETFGIRAFVVGTGGVSLYDFRTPIANSVVRDNTSYGVLKMTLKPGRYDWEFLPLEGQTFNDRGSADCNTGKPPAAPQQVQARVSAGTDDAEEIVSTGYMIINSTDVDLVADGSTLQASGLRFASVAIPRGATILNAYLQFRTRDATSGTAALTISGEARDQSATFSSATRDVTGRPRTTASVSWSPTAWAAGDVLAAQRTPSLAAIVQEIVNRPGWSSGNALTFIVQGTGGRSARSFEYRATDAPLLVIDYSP
jgi:hypothetical protein